MIVYLLLGTTYGFAAAVQPGPFQTYLISQALNIGWRRTVPAAFAPLISDIPIAILILGLLASVPAGFVQLLHYLGGAFVLYLAYEAFKSWIKYDANSTMMGSSTQRNIWKAALVNLLNPNPYLGWSLVMGPLLLKGWRETPANGITLIAAFYGTMILTTIGIIVLFAAARNFGPKITRPLILVSALALAGFGLYQLWLGYSSH
jgi:threonine/homoserine/homoserine lactone efflux protein